MKQCSECHKYFEKPERGAAQHGTSLCSMACANRWIAAKKLEQKLEEWNSNPVKCLFCSKPLDYMVWRREKIKKFCNSSCAAKANNKLPKVYKDRRPEIEFLNCKIIFRSQKQTYCSNLCRKDHTIKIKAEKIEKGEISRREDIKKYFLSNNKHECQICGNKDWKGVPIPLVLDHIDGNAGNNNLTNLRLICYNCDSQTPTYKSKNKGFGRGSRGLSLS